MASKPPLIVALCAAAGGLSALHQFFQSLPQRCESLSFVVVLQLTPGHEKVLIEMLKRATPLKVGLAESGQRLTGRSVTICPPGQYLEVQGGIFRLREPSEDPYLPADEFLRSLAQEVSERAVAVILSGADSDGSKGLLGIKEAGGLVMVQEETGAEYPSMPHAAIESGAADFVLSAGEIAIELSHYLEHLHDSAGLASVSNLSISEVVETLLKQNHIDFSGYKKDMLMRRVRRRMAVRQCNQIEDYRRILHEDDQEVRSLTRDILIGVTRFFRDPEAFRELDHQFVTPLLENRPSEALRLWVAGCSTGEEVYSLVMLFQERAARLGQDLTLKVFATDLDEESLEVASQGRYRGNIAADVPSELLSKYFLQTGDGYQVTRQVRECVLFSRHNLAKDPPFTNLDLISCRNLLIYFESELKRKVLSFLHFGLSRRVASF